MNYTFFITLIIVTTSLISCDLKSSEVHNKQQVKQDKKNNSSFDNAIILLNKGGIENIKLAIKKHDQFSQPVSKQNSRSVQTKNSTFNSFHIVYSTRQLVM